MDELCVAHTVVCALSFSSLMTPKMQSVKGIAEIVTLLYFPGAYSVYVLVLFLLFVAFSLVLYLWFFQYKAASE